MPLGVLVYLEAAYGKVVRQAHHERFSDVAPALTPDQGNRSINPSFRRKPESRTLGSRLVLFREDFLDSGFRRNDGCYGCCGCLGCPG